MTDRAGGYIPDAAQSSSLEKSGRPGITNGVALTGSSIALNGFTTVVASVTYRMRAYDSTLGYIVYWSADHVDDDGSQYSGPGPLTNVRVAKQLGA